MQFHGRVRGNHRAGLRRSQGWFDAIGFAPTISGKLEVMNTTFYMIALVSWLTGAVIAHEFSALARVLPDESRIVDSGRSGVTLELRLGQGVSHPLEDVFDKHQAKPCLA